MALIKCPKCGQNISDMALICPKCGSSTKSRNAYEEVAFEKKQEERPQTTVEENVKEEPTNDVYATKIDATKFFDESILPQKQKNAKKNKKGIAIVAICVVMLGVDICQQAYYSSNIKEINSQISDLRNSIKMIQSSSKSDSEKDSVTTSSDIVPNETDEETNSIAENRNTSNEQEIQNVEVGTPVVVNTDYGDFEMTVDGIKKVDWLERMNDSDASKFTIVLFEFDINNKSFDDPYNTIFYIDSYLVALDNSNYTVQPFGSSYDEGEYQRSPEVPIGARSKMFVPYKVKKDVTSITVNINKQYICSLAIAD